jgi:hypothetical protein
LGGAPVDGRNGAQRVRKFEGWKVQKLKGITFKLANLSTFRTDF